MGKRSLDSDADMPAPKKTTRNSKVLSKRPSSALTEAESKKEAASKKETGSKKPTDIFDPASFVEDPIECDSTEEEEVPKRRRLKRKLTPVVLPEYNPVEEEPEEEEYSPDAEVFTESLRSLESHLHRAIISSFPEMENQSEQLKTVIHTTMILQAADVHREHLGEIEPSDVLWMKGLSSKEVASLKPQYDELQKQVESQEPSIPAILKSKMPEHLRSDTLIQYHVYQTLDKYSDLWYSYRKGLLDRIWCNVSPQESDMLPKVPTVSLKQIVGSNIPDADKTLAVKYLQMLNSVSPASMDAMELETKIQGLLDGHVADAQKHRVLIDEEQRLSGVTMEKQSIVHKILCLDAPDTVKTTLLGMKRRADTLGDSQEASHLIDQLNIALGLPYNKTHTTTDSPAEYCVKLKRLMDERIYGMKSVKARIIESLHSRLSGGKSSIICLNGAPGTGKTSIVSAIADAIGVYCGKINIGGMADVTVLRGSDSHWSGSTPGSIVNILRKSGDSKCIILIDELDKLSVNDPHGLQVANSLLHILDGSQNHTFTDNFLPGIPIDLSRVLFMCTSNGVYNLPAPLIDRLEIIDVPSYSAKELVTIASEYTLPQMLQSHGMSKSDIKFESESICKYMIDRLNIENGGCRRVESTIKSIVEKLLLLKCMGTDSIVDYKLDREVVFPYTLTKKEIDTFVPKAEGCEIECSHIYL